MPKKSTPRTEVKTEVKEIKKEEKLFTVTLKKFGVICNYGSFELGKTYQVKEDAYNKLVSLGAV